MCGTCILRSWTCCFQVPLVYVDRWSSCRWKILTRLGQKLDEEVSVSVSVKIWIFFFFAFFCVVFVVVSLMVVVLYINALISLYLFAVTWSMWNSCLWRGWENKPSYQRVFSFGYQYRLGVFFGWRSKFVEIARERSFMGWNGQDRLSGWVDYCACCCCGTKWLEKVCVSMMGKLDISFCSLSERIGIHVRRFLLV